MTRSNTPLPFVNDVETIPQDEAEDIQRVVQALELILTKAYAKTGKFRSDVHVKTHGYAKGEFRVLPDLPEELAQGIFKQHAVHQAVVRFSNGSSQLQADAIPDGRGMAIKLLGIEGEMVPNEDTESSTQDFVMINHPAFFARNVKDYLLLEEVLAAANKSSAARAKAIFTGGSWNPLDWNWSEVLGIARITAKRPLHPAGNTYFSMVPIRYGQYVAKYRVKPTGSIQGSYLAFVKRLATHRDAMRLALEETLRRQGVLFEFQVQLRTSDSMPVEDASVEWPEKESPYRTVGHLVLPQQEIESLRQKAEIQNLAFNVWHALMSHRPLGGINRVRRAVYAVSSAWRRRQGAINP